MLNNFQRFLIVLGFIFASIWLSYNFSPQLPQRMPVHFNAQGKPDGYGSKKFALLSFPFSIAFLGVGYLISSYFIREPKYWRKKSKKPLSKEQVQRLIVVGTRLIDVSMILAMLLIIDIQWESFLVAVGKMQKLSKNIWVIIALMVGFIIYFSVQLYFISSRKEEGSSLFNQGS